MCSFQFSHSVLSNSVTPWTATLQASLSISTSWSLLKLMSIVSVKPPNNLILCHPLLLPPSIFPSLGVFSNESVLCIRWPKYWSFSFSISPSNDYSGLISFRIDWLNFLAVQENLKSLPQHHSSKASILWHSAFFILQVSNPYTTTAKNIALSRWTFVGKVISPLFIFFLSFLQLIYFNWRLIILQYCSLFCDTLTWISHGYTCIPHPEPPSHLLPHPIPQGHSSAPALSTLSHSSNLDWLPISHMIIYMFQCYSLKWSYPHLLPQSPNAV